MGGGKCALVRGEPHEAVEKGLGKRELEAKVKKVRAKETVGEKRGRKPDPELLKALRHATSAVEELTLKRFTPDRMKDLGKDALAMRLAVEKAYEKLGEVRRLLASVAYPQEPVADEVASESASD